MEAFKHKRGFCMVALDHPKDVINVGEVLRACGNYQAAGIAVSGSRYSHKKTDTMKAFRHIPLYSTDDLRLLLPFGCVPVAVDLIEGAIPLPHYVHPESAFYIFGAEDRTLGDSVTAWCKDVIYIPTNHCMNLAATVNVVLYDRMCKQFLKKERTA